MSEVKVGCSAVLFDLTRENVLLVKRSDNGLWCLPGGHFEPGETVSKGCEREVLEETGLIVRVKRLTGVYSRHPIVYPDKKVYAVVLNFEVEQLGGEITPSEETPEVKFFPVAEVMNMGLFHGHWLHILDALPKRNPTAIR
jgi:ADP-ribose pyrophosphatase YjhB (NUDIX family)